VLAAANASLTAVIATSTACWAATTARAASPELVDTTAVVTAFVVGVVRFWLPPPPEPPATASPLSALLRLSCALASAACFDSTALSSDAVWSVASVVPVVTC